MKQGPWFTVLVRLFCYQRFLCLFNAAFCILVLVLFVGFVVFLYFCAILLPGNFAIQLMQSGRTRVSRTEEGEDTAYN